MKHIALIFAASVVAVFLSTPLMAGTTYQCPDLSQAKQVGSCPGEEEVKRMFKATCGFERDKDAKNPDKCDTYAEFKRRKFNSLWESADGEFMGYLGCIDTATTRNSPSKGVAISQKNGLYKVICEYQNGDKLTQRTYNVCRVPGVSTNAVVMRGDCTANPSACKYECDK